MKNAVYSIYDITNCDYGFPYSKLITWFTKDDISRYCINFRQQCSKITKKWDKTKNAEWSARHYLSIKMILSASVMVSSAAFSKERNIRITEPYLYYYSILSCCRALIFTLPRIEWESAKILERPIRDGYWYIDISYLISISDWGDVRSERAWLVLQLFNIDNRFSHLINIISHVGLFPRWYRFRNAWQYQPAALAAKKCRYRRMRDVVAKLHYLHAISLKPLYLSTNPLPFSAPTRTYRMYPRSVYRPYSILRISFPRSIFQGWGGLGDIHL